MLNPAMDLERDENSVHHRSQLKSDTLCDEGSQTEKSESSEEGKESEVKSQAVVKYSEYQNPVSYAQLDPETNLNLPPSNWLRTNRQYPRGIVPHFEKSSDFSSCALAHNFLDYIGDVDVVSDAENIKKLLKMSYSKAPVSMMVHRVGKTLLLDEFDINWHLLRTAETEWEWLRKFYYEHVLKSLEEKEKLIRKNTSRELLQSRSLLSKFLYHSVAKEEEKQTEGTLTARPYDERKSEVPGGNGTGRDAGNSVQGSEDIPNKPTGDARGGPPFARGVLWTFEDIHMLIGSNMPIFGGGTHPCVSLRLHDMNHPITVLTGLDYWLDNLMCNVPQVLMCYHLQGIVHKYELFETEELPSLETSRFSPQLVRDVAQNILTFLKSNATKAGHTYWLFKAKTDDVVKLYDLTSLCQDSLEREDMGQNPYTLPVAMLLYRVAENMHRSEENRRKTATISTLLRNCISLLNPSKYPKEVASAYYILSDIYLPDNINPRNPEFEDQSEDSEVEDDEEDGPSSWPEREGTEMCSSVDVKSLCLSRSMSHEEAKFHVVPVTESVCERCHITLSTIVEGLEVLQGPVKDSFTTKGSGMGHGDSCDYETERCIPRPWEPIPMPYCRLADEKRDEDAVEVQALCRARSRPASEARLSFLVPFQKLSFDLSTSWHLQLTALLWQKASTAYLTLGEQAQTQLQHGAALKFAQLALRCHEVLVSMVEPSQDVSGIRAQALGIAGDAFCLLVQNWGKVEASQHFLDFSNISSSDKKLQEFATIIISSSSENLVKEFDIKFPSSLEESLRCSVSCYETGLELVSTEEGCIAFSRRLGNAHNELGVFLMNSASRMMGTRVEEEGKGSNVVKDLLEESSKLLISGVSLFQRIRDLPNVALLSSNHGRLMRMKAHYVNQSEDGFSQRQKECYNEALRWYEDALSAIGKRSCQPPIYDSITWELGSTLFTLASLMLENAPLVFMTSDEVEKEVVRLLQRALKFCNEDDSSASRGKGSSPSEALHLYRAACIHHKLASLHHGTIRKRGKEVGRKVGSLRQLAEKHYALALHLFLTLEHPKEALLVLLENIPLIEFFDLGGNGTEKIVLSALGLIAGESPKILSLLEKHESPETGDQDNAGKEEGQKESKERGEKEDETVEEEDELKRLLGLLVKKLQQLLLSLSGIHHAKGDKKGERTRWKKVYGASLTISNDSASLLSFIQKHLKTLH